MKRFETVLFDLDGTLTDSKEGLCNSVRHALAHFGIEETDEDKLRFFFGPPLRTSFSTLYGLNEAQCEVAVAKYREYLGPKGIYENKLYPGIREMLEKLKSAGLTLLICTAKPTEYARTIAEYFGIDAYFDGIFGATMDKSCQLKEDVIALALKKYGQTRCVMVGDRKQDLLGAEMNGIPSLGAGWGYASEGELPPCDPMAIAETPEKLGEMLCMERGLLITFEGQDGAGKSTQIKKAEEFLRGRGYEVVLSREPGGCPVAEKIRELLLDPENKDMDPMCEAYLYAAARAQHVRQVIRPALMQGKIVLCDRFIDSSIAYQGYGRGLTEQRVAAVNARALGGIEPDLTFYFQLDPEQGIRRNQRGGKPSDRLEMAGSDFRSRVYAGFRELAQREKERIVTLDAGEEIGKISEQVLNALREQLQLK